jgi:two-component system KDP operon response regulator KdpE
MKVLIVEDDADMRRLLKVVMDGLDVETEEAPDGESAIHSIETGDDPDLVLLDLHLPEISGEEVFDMIRKNSSSAIVIVTADILAAPGFIEKADGVFTKPFKMAEMIVKLNSLLAKGRRREGE